MTSTELQERLINFAVQIIKITGQIKSDIAGKTMMSQLVRSGTSPALNYGEAIGAESTRDFIHKMHIVLKELRETWVSLAIVDRSELCHKNELIENAKEECNQLISIFVKSIKSNKSKIN